MKKWGAWLLSIPISLLALAALLQTLLQLIETDGSFGAFALVALFPYVCFIYVCVHVIALIIGLFSKPNKTFLTLESLKKKGWIKGLGCFFICLYLFDFISSTISLNLFNMAWNILFTIVTLFYISWFNSFKFSFKKK